MRNQLVWACHTTQSSCVGLTSSVQGREEGLATALERESAQRAQLELQLREHVSDMMTLQARGDAERAELNARSGGHHGGEMLIIFMTVNLQ